MTLDHRPSIFSPPSLPLASKENPVWWPVSVLEPQTRLDLVKEGASAPAACPGKVPVCPPVRKS